MIRSWTAALIRWRRSASGMSLRLALAGDGLTSTSAAAGCGATRSASALARAGAGGGEGGAPADGSASASKSVWRGRWKSAGTPAPWGRALAGRPGQRGRGVELAALAGLAGLGEVTEAWRGAGRPWPAALEVSGPRAHPGTFEYVRAATSGSLPPVRSNWRTGPDAT